MWPIYFLCRAVIGAAVGGLAKDAPLKVAAVGLLWALVELLKEFAGPIQPTTSARFCEQYQRTQFAFFSIYVFGFLVIAYFVRRTGLRYRMYQYVSRVKEHRWWLRFLDAVAALILTALSAPWFLQAVREVLGLPASPVVDIALQTSSAVASEEHIRAVFGDVLGGGKSLLETFVGVLNIAFTGSPGTLVCAGDGYQGRWLIAMIAAMFCLPAIVGLSCDWFSSSDRWRSVRTLGLSDLPSPGDKWSPVRPVGLWVMVSFWGTVLTVVVLLIRRGTGV